MAGWPDTAQTDPLAGVAVEHTWTLPAKSQSDSSRSTSWTVSGEMKDASLQTQLES